MHLDAPFDWLVLHVHPDGSLSSPGAESFIHADVLFWDVDCFEALKQNNFLKYRNYNDSIIDISIHTLIFFTVISYAMLKQDLSVLRLSAL